jgi:hypothetical protein
MLLAGHSEIESVGEIVAYERRLWANASSNHLCSCGRYFSDCTYWNSILRTLKQRVGRDDISINNGDFSNFEINNQLLFEQILNTSGASVICDGSKNPGRLDRLLRSTKVTPMVVHLVRDARAVAYSMYRKGQKSGESTRKKYQFAHNIQKWCDLQEIALHSLAKSAVPYVTVRYEDLIKQPQRWLSVILNMANLTLQLDQLDRAGEDIHFIEGNRIRFGGLTTLELDDEYLKELSNTDWLLGTKKAEPLLTRFGYPLERASL